MNEFNDYGEKVILKENTIMMVLYENDALN